ncbi:hypothetical protein, partial [Nesterenkonia rhizosphaerae]|uniref:hypothetical protein n=1 Tax=Nesterenkonia rhizosphaerae TaxID=1348272 RepID=UPI0031ED84DD
HTTQTDPNTPTSKPTPQPCPIPEHKKAGRLAQNCPECWKLDDFPDTIPTTAYQRLHPNIRTKIDNRPYITITTNPDNT